MSYPILTDANAKILKGLKRGFLTGGVHFAPHTLSGHNVCPMASKGCAAACLNTAGRGIYQKVQNVRIRKTNWFFSDRKGFLAQLVEDIKTLERKAFRNGLVPALRLNLTSDISFENIKLDGKTLFEIFPHIPFYDYTKVPKRMISFLRGEMPKNYHLTFSRSETNQTQAELIASMGGNVAAVFDSKELPASYLGRPVINGDENDLRFLDPKGCIVGLSVKGWKGKKDKSGFVIPT
jgi:hypothetical protein